MKSEIKAPKVDDKEAAAIAAAARNAYGNDSADKFMDEVFAEARRIRQWKIAQAAKN